MPILDVFTHFMPERYLQKFQDLGFYRELDTTGRVP